MNNSENIERNKNQSDIDFKFLTFFFKVWDLLDDHHMKEKTIVAAIIEQNLFKLAEKKGEQYNFIKI